jgi:hypothetical protein
MKKFTFFIFVLLSIFLVGYSFLPADIEKINENTLYSSPKKISETLVNKNSEWKELKTINSWKDLYEFFSFWGTIDELYGNN